MIAITRMKFLQPLMFLSVFIFGILLSGESPAQTAQQIKDINTYPSPSRPEGFAEFNGDIYFQADDGFFGRELWKTDGTEVGTVMVKDIFAGSPAGFEEDDFEFFPGATIAYFFADSRNLGLELWKTDGTEAGTQLVKDLNPGSDSSRFYGSAIAVADTLYFAFEDDDGSELWSSDGTSGGTSQVKDINPGSNGSNPEEFVIFDGRVYFHADDGENGDELWVTDGTKDGTLMLKDINDNGTDSSNPRNFFEFNNKLYFGARDNANGSELWVTDGNSNGTEMVFNIAPGNENSNPSEFIEFNNNLYFAADDGNSGRELWKTDGTEVGTVLVEVINMNNAGGDSSNPREMVVLGNKLYFLADDGNGQEIWSTDSEVMTTTEAVTDLTTIDNRSPEDLFSDGSKLYFNAADAVNGREPWVSDGTTLGTALLADINVGDGDSGPSKFAAVGAKVLIGSFQFNPGINQQEGYIDASAELWASDGTPMGTEILKEINTTNDSSGTNNFTEFLGQLFFTARDETRGEELWKSDGTEEGTAVVKDINPGSDSSFPSRLTVIGNRLYFIASTEANGLELWSSDGTEGGTMMVKDIWLGVNSALGNAAQPVSIDNSTVFFQAFNGDGDGRAIWKSGGSEVNTEQLFDIGNNVPVDNMFASSTHFYFVAENTSNVLKVFGSDGTTEGTIELVPIDANGFEESNFVELGGFVYILIASGSSSYELWKTQGTPGTTELVKDGFTFIEQKIIVANDKLYFFAAVTGEGIELWESDGSGVNTVQISQFGVGEDGADSFDEEDFVATANGRLFFNIEVDGTSFGRELWTSDGTTEGTMLTRDIDGNNGSSNIGDVTPRGERVFFEADDEVSGDELWVSNGTASGTFRYRDIIPGILDSDPDDLLFIGDTLFMEIKTGTFGDELWKLEFDESLCWAIPLANGRAVSPCL
jgi:ELWxxDGT repeat protein